MDILTLELFDVTVSEALREISRVLEAHPALPLRILLGGDELFRHNIQRFLERQGRSAQVRGEGGRWRFEVAGPAAAAPALPAPGAASIPLAAPVQPAPRDTAAPAEAAAKPLLVTCSALGRGSAAIGRRLLLGVLRELDPAVPWVGLALEGLELLDDPQAVALLEELQARGIRVRISRESQLFPAEGGSFEIMEDSHWQRLLGRGQLLIL
jgi:hypothetical protein